MSSKRFYSSPPRLDELPDEVAYEFTFEGRLRLFHYYFRQNSLSKITNSKWTIEGIKLLRADFKRNELFSPYGIKAVEAISRHIDQHMLENVSKNV